MQTQRTASSRRSLSKRSSNGQCFDTRGRVLPSGYVSSNICRYLYPLSDCEIICSLTKTELVRKESRGQFGMNNEVWVDRPRNCPLDAPDYAPCVDWGDRP